MSSVVVSRHTRTVISVIMPPLDVKWGGGIFTVKMPFLSGKTAENVMGVYEFDCPAIF